MPGSHDHRTPAGFSGDRERVREASPIESVVGEYGVALRSDGRGFKALCPFHREKTPSFHVDPTRGIYRCFGCGEHGDVFSFVEKMDSVDFRGALQHLAERAGIALSSARPAASPRPDERAEDTKLLAWATRWFEGARRGRAGDASRAYLEGRGFRPGTIDSFAVGYAPGGWANLADAMRQQGHDLERGVRLGLLKRNDEGRVYDAFRQRVIFPIRDPRGRVVGFGGRHLDGAGPPEKKSEAPPKYINSPESELFRKGSVLYGHFEARDAIRTGRRLLLMEGYTDVMMAHQAGIDNAVATLGTALTDANVERITRLADRVTLVFDGDRAGFEAAHKAALLFAPRPIETRVVLLDGGADPCDLLATPAGTEQFRARVDAGVEALVFVLERSIAGEDLESAGGRDRAVRAFFGYVERLPTEIGRGTALERLASRLGLPFERVERDFRAGRAPRPRGDEESAGRDGDALPVEEEGILLAALAGDAEAGVVFRLRPPARFRDPVLARLAARIAAEGSELDPLGIDAAIDKAKALELVERRREIGHDEESAMRLLVELVRRHLRAIAREGQELLARGAAADEGWIRRITEIRRAVAELGARPPLEPEQLVEILDRFEVPGAEAASASALDSARAP